jgi:adenylate cyclase
MEQRSVGLVPLSGRARQNRYRTMADGVEIERKFVVDRLPDRLDDHPSAEIEQGYLAITDEVEVRVRRYGEQSFLTVKSGGDEVRVEEEIEIDARRFAALWPLTDNRRIEKRRYRIPAGALTIELDVYHGRLSGLLVAEVEFASPEAAAAFVPPEWLGREVTGDPRYKNQRLVTAGLPS